MKKIVFILTSIYQIESLASSEWIKVSQNADPTRSTAFIDVAQHPLRYEDLERLIGPGFERDLRTFSKTYRSEISSSSGNNEKDLLYNPSTRRKKHQTITIENNSNTTTLGTNKRNGAAAGKGSVIRISNATMKKNADEAAQTAAEQRSRRKPHNSKDSPEDSIDDTILKIDKPDVNAMKRKIKSAPPPAANGFVRFLQFVKNIQNSFAINTSRSIREKVKMLEHLKDMLMFNVGMFRRLNSE